AVGVIHRGRVSILRLREPFVLRAAPRSAPGLAPPVPLLTLSTYRALSASASSAVTGNGGRGSLASRATATRPIKKARRSSCLWLLSSAAGAAGFRKLRSVGLLPRAAGSA